MEDINKVIAEYEDIQKSLNAGYGVVITEKSELVRDTLELLKTMKEEQERRMNSGAFD